MYIEGYIDENVTHKGIYIKDNIESTNIYINNDVPCLNYIPFTKEHIHYYHEYFTYLTTRDHVNPFTFQGATFKKVPGTTIFCRHILDSNYSHFILNALGTFLLAKDNGLLSKTINIAISNKSTFQKQLIEICGIDKFNIIELEPHILYQFEKLIYSNIYFDYIYHHTYISLFERLTHNLKIKSKINLYITRSNAGRRAINQEEVVNYFKARNFEIVDFDKIPVLLQIILVNNASILCAEHGASGANLVWRSPEDFKFIEIFSDKWVNSHHANLLHSKNCEYSFTINSALNPENPDPFSPYKINLALLDQALQQPSYTFTRKQIEMDVNKIKRDILNEVSLAIPEKLSTILKIRQDEAIGDYEGVLHKLSKIDIDKMDNQHLYAYCKAILMSGNYLQLQSIFLRLRNISFKTFKRLFCDMCIKLFSFDSLKSHNLIIDEGRSLKSATLKRILNEYTEISRKLLNYPADALLTWHNNFLCVNDKGIFTNGINEDNYLTRMVYGNILYLFSPKMNKYIVGINDDCSVIFGDNPIGLYIEKHNEWNFSIKYKNKYLSSINNGKCRWAPCPREWERYFIRDAIILKRFIKQQ